MRGPLTEGPKHPYDKLIYIYIYIYVLCTPRRGGASHEQLCDFGIMGMWYSRVPQNHHNLHPFLGGHMLYEEFTRLARD